MDLRTARKEAGYTQESFALKIGVKRLSVARYESGTRKPSRDIAIRFAAELGLSTEQMWEMLYRTSKA